LQKGNLDTVFTEAFKKVIAESNLRSYNTSGFKEETAEMSTVYSGYREDHPTVTVWCWCRGLSDSDDYLDGKLVNLTPFIDSVTISKNKGTGNFQLSMSPVFATREPGSESSVVYSKQPSKTNFGKWTPDIRHPFFDANSANDMWQDGRLKRRQMYIPNIISQNDIMFIRMESLGQDTPMSHLSMTEIELDPRIIEGKNFDMIGLVNMPDAGLQASDYNPKITITGSDLVSKLLTEDGSGIYAQRFMSNGKEHLEADFSGGIVRYMGKYTSSFQILDQTIKDQILFIIDYQSRSKICNDFFNFFKNRRRTKLDVPESSVTGGSVDNIWSIVDVAVDDNIANRRSFNANMGNAYQPLISQIRSVCVEPLVEFFGDTYGDKYYLVARKPPFDRKSIQNFIDAGLVITIREEDIIQDKFSYETTAYSWYKLDYKLLASLFTGDVSWLIPAIYFDEFGAIFGDKPLRVQDPYIDMMEKVDQQSKDGAFGKEVINQQMYDLKYIVESNMYLPFTRRGSISVRNMRGVKFGSWIYHEGTGEIFYVDNVSHSFTVASKIDASTVIGVSRGMVLESIDDYFSVIDLPLEEAGTKDFSQYITDTLKSWKVVPTIFNRLIRKRNRNEEGKSPNNETE
jgi:hypothetical protein